VIVAGTGHRPPRLGLGYDGRSRGLLRAFAAEAVARLTAEQGRPTLIVSGMAQGWDRALAEAAVDLGIPFEAAVPFAGQESAWPAQARREYGELLGRACAVTVLSDGYSKAAFHKRDRYMVDRAELVAALFDGGKAGGTAVTVAYAGSRGKRVVNFWSDWERVEKG
jgi:uncharacterized phage-like protein YoqJ